MLRDLIHVVQVADLVVRAVNASIDDQVYANAWVTCLQSSNDRYRRVIGVGDAENDLKLRVVLPTEGGEVVEQIDVQTLQRFEDGHPRKVGFAGSAALGSLR